VARSSSFVVIVHGSEMPASRGGHFYLGETGHFYFGPTLGSASSCTVPTTLWSRYYPSPVLGPVVGCGEDCVYTGDVLSDMSSVGKDYHEPSL
jgi:hypothetical protein